MEPDYESSRSTRKQKDRQDRFLNWAIAIVAILILIVGSVLIVMIKQSPSDKKAGSYIPHHTNKTDTKSDPNKSSDGKTPSNDTTGSTNSSNQTDSSNTETNTNQGDANQTTSGDTTGGINGPWQPIGTSQTEPHHKSYQKGSQDWNEMIKALAYAIGTQPDNMTTWWLGNGGGPDLSVGKVSEKGHPDKKYKVELQWIPNKGWKPTSVTPIDNNQ